MNNDNGLKCANLDQIIGLALPLTKPTTVTVYITSY